MQQFLLSVSGGGLKVMLDQILESGDIPVVTQEVGAVVAGYANVKDAITDLPVIVFGDHSCTFKYVDFPFVRGADGTQLLKFDSNLFDARFMCHYLRHQKIENQDRYERHMKYLKQLEINVPAVSEQKKIVGQIDRYEAEIKNAEAKLAKLDMQKKEVLMQYLKGGDE